MTIDFATLVAILAMAAATVLTRLSGLVLIRHVSLEGSRRKAIDRSRRPC